MPEVILPVGVLRAEGDAPPRVDLRCARTERRRHRDWFERIAGLGLPWLALPERITDAPNGLVLEYAAVLGGSVTVGSRAADWNLDLAAALPQVMGLARFTLNAADELAKQTWDGVPLCPALIRSLPSDPVPWRFFALPAGAMILADWAKSDADAWGWSSSIALLAGQGVDAVYTLGAALHQGLVGVMFPEALHQNERFARALRGRVGLPARLDAAARASVPPRSRSDAENLRSLVLNCLNAKADHRTSGPLARKEFADLESRLTADRLARLWDADNRPAVAEKLRRQAAPPPPKQEPAPPALQKGQDWSDLAREQLAKGEIAAALSSAWNAVFAEGPQKCDVYLITIQRAAAVSSSRAEIAAALARLEQAYTPDLIGEANLLRVAHIRMRYLGAAESDVAVLLRTSQSDWTRAVGIMLRAVYQVRKNAGYAEASRQCKEAGAIFTRMPQGGGEVGKYARAYLNLLDGIAHIGFVAAGGPPDYYSDALTRFGTTLQLADEIGARDLLLAAAQWLSWLSWLSGLTPGPAAATIRTAADAILKLYSATGPGRGVSENPDVPWYDEAYIFPV